MLEHFDEELCDWLITEMAQNRDKKLVARKVCNALAGALAGLFRESDSEHSQQLRITWLQGMSARCRSI